MRFSHPLWLLLLVAIPWIVASGRKSRVRPRVIVARLILVICLALAAAGTRLRGPDGPASVVFVLDRSESVLPAEQARAAAQAARFAGLMRQGDRAAVVAFGRDAVIDQPLSSRAPLPNVTSPMIGDQTNVEAALRVARAALPRDGARRIVLFSDGRDTTGDPLREAAVAGADGIRIDAVPLSARPVQGIQVVRVTAPSEVRMGEPYSVIVDVAGGARETGRISIERDGREIDTRIVSADAAGTARITVDERQPIAGAAVYTARAIDPASGMANRGMGSVVIATGAPALLYVGNGPGRIDRLLSSGPFRVSQIAPSDLPTTAAGFGPFGAVILDDVPAESMNASQNRALAAFVEEQGGGLLLLGTSKSIGPAGYPGTRIGDGLPVDLRRKNGSRAPQVALVVIFDKSGSMADAATGVTKIELARRAVLSVLQVVPATDPVGVVAFDTNAVPIAPLSTGHAAETLMAQLRGVEPGGSTAITPAIETAREWLRASSVARRQILLLSDGRSAPSDVARLLPLARMRDVEWSIVAIGSDADRAILRQLAQENGGHVYFPESVDNLPDIVAREAARVTGGWQVQERFLPRALSGHPVLTGVEGGIPSLDGYVTSAAKTNADVILSSHLGDPILSAWRFGLGRVAVFTAGMSPEFRGWEGFAPLWRQTVRWIGRGHDSQHVHAEISAPPGSARLVVDVTTAAGEYANAMTGEATIRGPGNRIGNVSLRQTEPGRYEADVPASEPGAYFIAVSLAGAQPRDELRALFGFFWSGGAERSGEEADLNRLGQITRASGGALLGDSDSPFTGPRPAAYRDISTVLAMIALFVYLVEIGIRRGVSPAWLRELWRSRSRDGNHASTGPATNAP